MAFLVDDKEMAGALELAARRPFEGVDPGFAARFAADFDAMANFSNSNASHRNALAVQNDFQVRFYKESGQRLPGWIDSMNANAMEVARKQFDQWKAANPESSLAFPTEEDFLASTDNVARDARAGAQALDRRSTGAASAVGGFLGTVAGALSDPVNLMSLGFGASASAGVIRTALTEAAVGALSESAIQGATLERKQRIDPAFTTDEAFAEVLAAGAGGALLGGGLKGLANVWHRARTGEWPRHIKDAGNVLAREAAIPDSRFERSMAGENAHRAALEKAVDDITRGRPVELPPEAFLQQGARPGRVYDADGNSIGVRYEVVDADSLITSNRDDLSINPAFPQELQPRDRSRAMSQDQIAGIAANLQPERLGFSTDAGTGAPVVGADGLVESGNGRVLALRRAYQNGGVPAENYRNFLRAQNFDVDGLNNPVLIARRVTDLEDRVGFVTAANRSTAMRLGAAEQALSDARMIDTALLDSLGDGDVAGAGNAAFTRGFMARLPRAEQGNLIDRNGILSQEGGRRITAALMGRAYGEPALLGRALEDTDNNIKAIGGAMSESAGTWARMRDAVARGEIPAGMDITDDLVKAVQLVMRARDEGRAVSDLVNQAEMFGGPGEMAKIMARAMFSDADMKRPVGRARLAAFLRDYADEAMKNDAGPRLIGDPLTAPDIMKGSLERVGRNDLYRVADERLTPEAMDDIAASPETREAAIMDAERLVADNEARQLGPIGSSRFESFQTSKGSQYTVHEDGTTSRNKAARSDPGHDGDSGQKARTAKTIYLDSNSGELSSAGLQGAIKDWRVALKDGHAVLLGRNPQTGDWGISGGGKGVKFHDEPAVGRFPLELWNRSDDARGLEGYAKMHAGNQITTVKAKDANPIMVDIGDGRGERSLDDILREADEEIAAGREIEACTLGSAAE